MRWQDDPQAYAQILLPRRSGEIIARFEALTEPEIRSEALAILRNPIFQWVLVELQDQAIQSIRITRPGPDQDWQCLMLAAIDTFLGAFIGQALTTRELPLD